MIGKLKGLLDEIGEDHCTVDVGGVGYVVFCPTRALAALPRPGEAVTLFIETYVREDMIRLYGFQSALEREWFRMLMGSVQGVGARVALSILSTLAPYLIPLVIAPFGRRYPRVELVFEELVADAIVDGVRRDLLDAGLVATPPPARGVEEVRLFDEPLVGYVAPGHRLYGQPEIGADEVDVRPDQVEPDPEHEPTHDRAHG